MAMLVIGGVKGGVGKSTLAENAVVMRAITLAGRRRKGGKKPVLLVDADPTRAGVNKFHLRRSEAGHAPVVQCELMLGTGIYHNLLARRDDYEDIIVDCGGHDSPEIRGALMLANQWIIPTRPNQTDLDSFEALEQLAALMLATNPSMRIRVMLSQVRDRTIDKKRAEWLTELAEFPLCGELMTVGTTMRSTYELTRGSGLAVVEFAAKREIALREMQQLNLEIWK